MAAERRFARTFSSARSSQSACTVWLARTVLKASEAEPPRYFSAPFSSPGCLALIGGGAGLVGLVGMSASVENPVGCYGAGLIRQRISLDAIVATEQKPGDIV